MERGRMPLHEYGRRGPEDDVADRDIAGNLTGGSAEDLVRTLKKQQARGEDLPADRALNRKLIAAAKSLARTTRSSHRRYMNKYHPGVRAQEWKRGFR